MQRTGIVLKQLNSPYKFAILDQDRGRIDAVTMKAPCVGSLLHYTIESQRGHYFFLSHCSMTNLPFSLARNDLLFWHHVLELCLFFVPVGYRIPDLFDLLLFLYTKNASLQHSMQAKKLYLFKLLAAIGLYDALPQLVPADRVQRILSAPIEHIMGETLDAKSERVVDEWLRTCIAEHPQMEQFNTVHFLVYMDDHE